MIVLRAELWPMGDEEEATEISTAIIFNDGTGDIKVGNYDMVVGRQAIHPHALYRHREDYYQARVEKHERELPVWELLRRGLNALADDTPWYQKTTESTYDEYTTENEVASDRND